MIEAFTTLLFTNVLQYITCFNEQSVPVSFCCTFLAYFLCYFILSCYFLSLILYDPFVIFPNRKMQWIQIKMSSDPITPRFPQLWLWNNNTPNWNAVANSGNTINLFNEQFQGHVSAPLLAYALIMNGDYGLNAKDIFISRHSWERKQPPEESLPEIHPLIGSVK